MEENIIRPHSRWNTSPEQRCRHVKAFMSQSWPSYFIGSFAGAGTAPSRAALTGHAIQPDWSLRRDNLQTNAHLRGDSTQLMWSGRFWTTPPTQINSRYQSWAQWCKQCPPACFHSATRLKSTSSFSISSVWSFSFDSSLFCIFCKFIVQVYSAVYSI